MIAAEPWERPETRDPAGDVHLFRLHSRAWTGTEPEPEKEDSCNPRKECSCTETDTDPSE